ncbi:MAG: formimidoylglutamase [Reichenbachiella sp.]
MDLKLYFDPIEEKFANDEFSSDSLIQSFYLNEEILPDLDQMDLAIIGLYDSIADQSLEQTGISVIREKLYNLKKGDTKCSVIDLGNLRNGHDHDDTCMRLKTVCQKLIARNILPIIIGGPHSLDYGQYQAYEDEEKLINILNVDSRFDLYDKSDSEDEKHVHKIFTHEPNFLFHYNQLAYQSYLINPKTLKVIEQLKFSALRLGEMREDFKKVEPIVREADMLTFDISAINKIYAPGGRNSEIFGLTGEEACQIMWYAGMNDKLSSVGVYGYLATKDSNDHQTAMVMATMVWYFIEGFKNRKGEKGFQTNDYLKYVVSLNAEPETIVFYRSRLSDKWWMEIPNINHTGIYDRNYIVPCDPSDYETATSGEIPERWISVFSKLS